MGTAVILFGSAPLSFLQWSSLAAWHWAEQLGLAAGPCVMPLSSTVSSLTSSPPMARLLLPAQTFCSSCSSTMKSSHFFSTSALIGAPAHSYWEDHSSVLTGCPISRLVHQSSSSLQQPEGGHTTLFLRNRQWFPCRLKIHRPVPPGSQHHLLLPSLSSRPATRALFLCLSTKFIPAPASGPLHLLLPPPRALLPLSLLMAVCLFGIF